MYFSSPKGGLKFRLVWSLGHDRILNIMVVSNSSTNRIDIPVLRYNPEIITYENMFSQHMMMVAMVVVEDETMCQRL